MHDEGCVVAGGGHRHHFASVMAILKAGGQPTHGHDEGVFRQV